VIGSRFPGTQGAHLLVDDGMESSAEVMAASPAFMSQAPRP
jgi:hypothetical protein